MKLIIQDRPHDIFAALSGATLGDLRDLPKLTKARGAEITMPRVRTYLVDDVLKNKVPFGHIDTDEKLLCMQALVWLCWRHAAGEPEYDGPDHVFDDTLKVPLAEIRVEIETDDLAQAPKEPTDSDPGDDDTATK